jgi:integrase
VRRRDSAAGGQIYRQPSGLWAIRYRDGHGNRPQLTGYRTKAEARQVLEELLREVRLGALYRPNATLRQVLAAGVRWKWVEDNPAALVKNPERKPGEIDPFDSWAEIDAALDEVGGALVQFLCETGVRPEEAFGGEWRDVDLERRMFRVRRAYAKGRLKDFANTAGSTRAVPLRERVVSVLEAMPGNRRGILFPAPEGGRVPSTTGAIASGRRPSRRRRQAAGSTTCGTRTRRGAWRPALTSSRWPGGWA